MGQKRSDYIPSDKYEVENWAEEFHETASENVNHYGINAEELKVLLAFITIYSADLKAEKKIS